MLVRKFELGTIQVLAGSNTVLSKEIMLETMGVSKG